MKPPPNFDGCDNRVNDVMNPFFACYTRFFTTFTFKTRFKTKEQKTEWATYGRRALSAFVYLDFKRFSKRLKEKERVKKEKREKREWKRRWKRKRSFALFCLSLSMPLLSSSSLLLLCSSSLSPLLSSLLFTKVRSRFKQFQEHISTR